jgi:CD109 antigen
LTIVKRVPDTITSWIITGFALSSEHGLGLTKSPTKLTVFRPFFVSAFLPYSVKRGEVLKIPVTVFNYTPKSVKATVFLHNKDNEFEFMEKGNGYILSQEVDVALDNGATAYFTIKPIKVGYIVLTITARTDIAGDGIELPLLVLPEGVKKQANKAVLLDLRNKTAERTSFICNFPADIIPDSVKIELSAIGDILGPTISNLDSLVSVPCGCGEQNLILMVPSILVYDYLKSVDKMTEKMETKIRNCISIGYQNELRFQHRDGSFSAFGEFDQKGSVWLTAFAIKSFIMAKKLKFDVDQKVINRAMKWLRANQAPNGSFPEVGNVIDKDMQGDAGEGLALTVYTTIALIQSVEDVFNDPKYKAIVEKAVAFIAEKVVNCDVIYTIAMAAYCLQLAKHDSKDVVMKKLAAMAIETDGLRYWEKPGSQTKAKNSWCAPSSVNVEITSYALLAHLAAGDEVSSVPILKWLIGQRNGKGGGQSTQDTVLSLEAIACFAKKIFSSAQNLNLLITSGAKNLAKLNINKENAMVLQKVELPDKITKVDVSIKGSGIALVQVAYEYNVSDIVKPVGFNLDVRVNSAPETTVLNLIVKANFSPHGGVKVSNMALLEITFPSGFCFDTDCKPAILAIPKVKKIETQNGDTKKRLIIPVTATKMFDVAEQKPSIVEIYDYYENCKLEWLVLESNSVSNLQIFISSTPCEHILFAAKPVICGKFELKQHKMIQY